MKIDTYVAYIIKEETFFKAEEVVDFLMEIDDVNKVHPIVSEWDEASHEGYTELVHFVKNAPKEFLENINFRELRPVRVVLDHVMEDMPSEIMFLSMEDMPGHYMVLIRGNFIMDFFNVVARENANLTPFEEIVRIVLTGKAIDLLIWSPNKKHNHYEIELSYEKLF